MVPDVIDFIRQREHQNLWSFLRQEYAFIAGLSDKIAAQISKLRDMFDASTVITVRHSIQLLSGLGLVTT